MLRKDINRKAASAAAAAAATVKSGLGQRCKHPDHEGFSLNPQICVIRSLPNTTLFGVWVLVAEDSILRVGFPPFALGRCTPTTGLDS